MALKKNEIAVGSQIGFGFRKSPTPALRAVHVTVNTSAREAGLQFFKNWRVPAKSVIADVYNSSRYAESWRGEEVVGGARAVGSASMRCLFG